MLHMFKTLSGQHTSRNKSRPHNTASLREFQISANFCGENIDIPPTLFCKLQ